MCVEKREHIRSLNDQLRRHQVGGRVVVTQGVLAMGAAERGAVMLAISGADDFTSSNDPYDEHDFGTVWVCGRQVFWKIDYYDHSLTSHAPDPSDAKTCIRVLTIMLTEEY